MPNLHVQARLEGIQKILNGAYHANSTMSSASKGAERAAFIDEFLSKVLPSPYRFGTGDATDRNGKRSGQLDVVVEYPFIPSLPIVGTGTSRLYLAESVAAVVEVKSDVAAQWSEVVHTARQLEPLQRQFGADRYERLNDPTFLAYGGREYDAFRIEAFWEDGSRFPDEQLVANIVRQTAG